MALDNEFVLSELMNSGSAALNQTFDAAGNLFVNTNNTTDGDTFGYVERPIYNETQLIKAVDTVVDELITTAKPVGPATVLKTTYDDLTERYNKALSDIRDLSKQLSDALQTISRMQIEIDDLKVQLDLEKLLRASAEAERDTANEKYTSTILDLQVALSKGVKEGIERVSTEAQLQGVLAEKSAFIEFTQQAQKQLENANNQIIDLGKQLNEAFIQLAKSQGEAISQANLAAANAAAASANAPAPKKGTIICTEMYNQGLMPENIFLADRKFGYHMYKNNKNILQGYWQWANPIVEWMKQNPTGTKVFYYTIVKHWSEHMAYKMGTLKKDNLYGNLIHKVGVPFSKLVYYMNKSKVNKLGVVWQ